MGETVSDTYLAQAFLNVINVRVFVRVVVGDKVGTLCDFAGVPRDKAELIATPSAGVVILRVVGQPFAEQLIVSASGRAVYINERDATEFMRGQPTDSAGVPDLHNTAPSHIAPVQNNCRVVVSSVAEREFTAGDIVNFKLLKRLSGLHEEVRVHLEAHVPSNEKQFFEADLVHSIRDVLEVAVDRVLPVRVVADAIDRGAGKLSIANALRIHAGLLAADTTTNNEGAIE